MLVFIDDRPVIHLVAQATDTTDRTGSYTFSGLNFGDDFSNRTLVALIHLVASGNNRIDQGSCTIGGVGAAGGDSGDAGPSPVGGAGAGVWAAKPSGTSGNVTVNFSTASASACAIYLYAVTDLASATPFAESFGSGGGGGITSDPTFPASMNGTLNVPSDAVHGAVIFGAASRANNTSAITLVGMTQQYDTTLDGSHRIAGGYAFRLPQETNRTVGLSTGAGNVIFGMEARSFS
ncbi:hypothetical protein [Aminobacter aminovorans]|uniref:Uncharacterized protein n=1 Tax=Aminobacter aminovorans TaxID=83263 RepID=A0AAC9FD92_AMIAI|nr:hypothetical protein [Aminobacter aminovorans]AMS40502.1 hypothetical protein AA2016_1570 [Aminobacter aminovorans]MBB3706566.1 hypothetical protein [Aminobacter aminovorans]